MRFGLGKGAGLATTPGPVAHCKVMEIVAVDPERTLLVSGLIDDWAEVKRQRVDTIVDMDGDVDAGVPAAPSETLDRAEDAREAKR